MKKIYLWIIVLVFTLGCQKDEITETLHEEKLPQSHQLLEIPFKELPSSLTEYFKRQNSIKSSDGNLSGIFGRINVNVPLRRLFLQKEK